MRAPYDIPLSFGRWGASPAVDSMRLHAALELLAQVDEEILRAFPELPGPYRAALEGRVRYVGPLRTPDGEIDRRWSDVFDALDRREASCMVLAAWRVAELRVRHGIDASCSVTCRKTAGQPDRCHVIVSLPDGSFEDPSVALGMQG